VLGVTQREYQNSAFDLADPAKKSKHFRWVGQVKTKIQVLALG